MLSDPYEFIWHPQRPARTKEQVEADIEKFKDVKLEKIFSFEDRIVVRELIHIVIDDENFRNIFNGLFLPPPYILPSLAEKRWTGKDVARLVGLLDPSLDGVVVSLPFNMAVQIGNYSARLHAASQRLSWVLNVPIAIVEAQEKMSLKFYEEYVRNSDVNPRTPVQKSIEEHREQRKWTLKRTATIAGFSTLGGAALLVSGGLAAPMMVSAYAALSSGLTTTITAIGTFGGAVLGTGALASAFAAAVGVSTHAAALTSLLTPVLTASHITSIFGVTGAALSGYRAYCRTSDSGVFLIRAVDEVEVLPDLPDTSSTPLTSPVNPFTATAAAWELGSDIDVTTRPGLVFPAHTFLAVAANTRKLPCIRRSSRQVIFSIAAKLPGRELRLLALKLTTGVWALLPPPVVPFGEIGMLACRNRQMYPTGAGFVLCYAVTQAGEGRSPVSSLESRRSPVSSLESRRSPVSSLESRRSPVSSLESWGSPVSAAGGGRGAELRVWVRVHCDVFGAWELSCFTEGTEVGLDPLRAEIRLETETQTEAFSKARDGLTMTMRCKPFTYLKLTPFEGMAGKTTQTFPAKDLSQRMPERDCDVNRRRKVGIAIVNQSMHTVCAQEVSLVNGIAAQDSGLPQVIESRTALLEFYTNQGWDLRGAEGFYILEVRNTNDSPLVNVYFVRLQFEISSLNNLGVAVATAHTVSELKKMSLVTQRPESSDFEVKLNDGLFFSLNVRIVEKFKTIQLRVLDKIEHQVDTKAVKTQAKLTVGICGFSAIFDPRRPPQDQQIGLWNNTFKDLSLLGESETYALQWEDEYLDHFGKSVDVDFNITDRVTRKAFGKAKAMMKKNLMQGAIFSGFRAFKSLMGSMYIPRYVMQSLGAIDNAFATLSNRSVFAGLDLAKALLDTRIGHRPVTLIGFSFGCNVVCECLLELHRVKAFNLIDNVFMIGSMVPADTDVWTQMREVTAGRLVNLYTRSDFVLWLMYRANDTDLRPMAGISPINLPGIENIDVTPIVARHYDYGFRIRDVLKSIPLQPTEETWSKKDMRGSPGIIVPFVECERTMTKMGKSIASILFSHPFCVLSLVNNLVSDEAGSGLPLELISFSVHNGFFDFRPPQSVPPLSAGVFGAVGESGVDRIGGVVSFIARLDGFSDRDMMLIIFFDVEKKSTLSMAAYPSLVMRRGSEQETSEEAKKRICTIASQTFEDFEVVRKICNSEAAMHTGVNKIISQTVKFPTDCFFTDGHKQATMFIDLERVSNGISISVRALLTKASSEPQQEHFTGEVYHSLYDNHYITVAAEEKLGVAEIYPLEEFHKQLTEIAGRLNGKQMEGKAQAKESDRITELRMSEIPIVEPTIIPVVIANCSEVPLHLIEPETISEDDSKSEDADSVDSSELGSLNINSSSRLCAPPPKLPPHSFCVATFSNLERRSTLSVNYTTARGICGFNIYIPTPVDASYDVEKDPLLVKCDRLSAHNVKEAVSTSITKVGDTVFQQVFLALEMTEETSTTTNPNDTSMSEQLKKHGWHII